MSLTRETVLDVLKSIPSPAGGDLTGQARAVTVDGDTVRFVLEIDPAMAEAMTAAKLEAEAKIKALGAASVSVVMTAHSTPKAPDLKPAARPAPAGPERVPGVKKIIAVASGKGGVGKSTVSANLAAALALEGKKVGLLDADVYGPSQHRMFNITKRPATGDGKMIIPVSNHGVTLMSMGMMTKDGEAVVWRGPMLMGALQQMLFQVQWGELDALIVDLPPGTGDVQMTLAQKTFVDGAIVVSTPQDIALLDARKGIDMFRKFNVPLFGLIENMSVHVCSNCGHAEHIFGHGGVAAEAEALGTPLLAEIPLHIDIRTTSDSGAPVVVAKPDSPQAQSFRQLAQRFIAGGIV